MKKIISLILILALTLTLSGCGSDRKRFDEFTYGIEDVIEYECWREGRTTVTVKYYCVVKDENGEQQIRVTKDEMSTIRRLVLGLEDLEGE
jgi:ABC-type uncharacterized transport system auxiliary subunit